VDSRVAEAEGILQARGPHRNTGRFFECGHHGKEVISMSVPRACPFHRISRSIETKKGLTYCDLDGSQTICDGDPKFCGEPDILDQYRLIQMLEKNLQEGEEGLSMDTQFN
jgi:hypothetical protein